MGTYRLARPIVENRAALRARFPEAKYLGDIGDRSHLRGSGDHPPYSSDVIFGIPMPRGVVMAHDLGGGGRLRVPDFARWLLDRLRAGAYPEVKYVISRHPENRGVEGGRYYGLFDRRFSWRCQHSSGHTDYVHTSYMPRYEDRDSSIVADYHDYLTGAAVMPASAPAAPTLKKWSGAPPLPDTPLGRYSTRPLSRLPYIAYPPIVPGYGGKEAPAQRDFVAALLAYALKECRTRMITAAEFDRSELGEGAIAWAYMITTTLAGNPWVNDPIANGRALGAAIGAPASW
jgi:hypothetical protein